jgi:hypothetical protein
MARIDEDKVKFPFSGADLPEGKLAVASCDANMVLIKVMAGFLPAEQARTPIIVNIENGIVHELNTDCTYRVLEDGAKIELEVKA